MTRPLPRRPGSHDADAILHDLTTRQHLFPHRPVGQVLAASAADVAFCPSVADRALAWLQIDPATAVGRLPRTQLSQLARCLDRLSRQALAEASRSAPPHGAA